MLEGGLGCDPGNYESSGPYRTCQRGLYCPGSGDRGGKDRCIYGGNIMDAMDTGRPWREKIVVYMEEI